MENPQECAVCISQLIIAANFLASLSVQTFATNSDHPKRCVAVQPKRLLSDL
jgi:hypothetical protein